MFYNWSDHSSHTDDQKSYPDFTGKVSLMQVPLFSQGFGSHWFNSISHISPVNPALQSHVKSGNSIVYSIHGPATCIHAAHSIVKFPEVKVCRSVALCDESKPVLARTSHLPERYRSITNTFKVQLCCSHHVTTGVINFWGPLIPFHLIF